ncbi:MAG: hypothetical protein BWY74_02778 [Firmicutes bacterium ADurb.Bin419]|nr:MAG: hypothetical protein BWY74_02778 [Firmicutes bacterium ADurb.Bin419]
MSLASYIGLGFRSILGESIWAPTIFTPLSIEFSPITASTMVLFLPTLYTFIPGSNFGFDFITSSKETNPLLLASFSVSLVNSLSVLALFKNPLYLSHRSNVILNSSSLIYSHALFCSYNNFFDKISP